MAAATITAAALSPRRRRAAPTRWLLVGAAVILSLAFLVAPLAVIFGQAFSKGLAFYWHSIAAAETLHAILLTVVTAIVVVPVNIGFGIAAAWAIAKFDFAGKKLLTTLIELPFSVSPVVAGVTYLLLYGAQGLFGPALERWDVQVMFTVPAIWLVSLFITSPFVVRELLPLMQTQGRDDEEAAVSLGAGFWQTFRRVTLPNVKWALLYGAILCNARVMGEFGGVSVVSGNIRGETNTLPLQVEVLYNDYNATGAFAAATALALLALVTLGAKAVLERRAAVPAPAGARH